MQEFSNRAEWRSWLAKNHTKKKEVWVVYFKKSSGKQGLSYDEAVEEALCYGWIDGIEKSVDAQRFKQRFTPRRPGSNWSESNKARASKLIQEGKMRKAGMETIKAAKNGGKW